MNHPTLTLLGVALVAALAAGPAWTQGAGPSSPMPSTSPGAAGSTGTPGSRGGAAPAASSALARADRTFVEAAARAGMAEVAAGKVAMQRAQDPAVRQFAQQMVEDHTAANEDLMKLAQQKGVAPPADPDRTHRREMDAMAKRSGADFDRAYMKAQVADHQKTVSVFEKQAKSGKDEDLKQWAAKMLPTLQQHLQRARDMQGSIAGGASTTMGTARPAGSPSGSGLTPGVSGSAVGASAASGAALR